MNSVSEIVLVTGASGYLGTHIIKQLLENGYSVRGTVRNLKDEKKVSPVRKLAKNSKHELDLCEADLLNEESWLETVKDCTYVIHTAQPVPSYVPSDENEVIRPAVFGVLNVFKACVQPNSKVRRVIYTSSIAAISGDNFQNKIYTENDYSKEEDNRGYIKSKVLAERAAWNFVKERQNKGLECFELVVLNPGYIMGPVLHDTHCSSMEVVKKLLNREIPMLADTCLPGCHVDDVAKAHLISLKSPDVVGHRHIIVSSVDSDKFTDYAKYLNEEFSSKGYSVPTWVAPNFLLRLVSYFDREVSFILPMLGKEPKFDNSRLREVLKIEPLSTKQAIIEMAYSMIERGMIEKKY